jgi:hypothetical protein
MESIFIFNCLRARAGFVGERRACCRGRPALSAPRFYSTLSTAKSAPSAWLFVTAATRFLSGDSAMA